MKRKLTEKCKKSISIALRGNKNGCGNKGRVFSEEHKRKISLAMKGRKPSRKTIEAVIKALKGKKLPRWHRKKLSDYWKTHEKEGRFFKGMIPWNKGLKGYQSGEKHYNWKGGITIENNKLHGSTEYKNWRKAIFQRDNYTCQVCHKRGVYLMAHHIKSFNEFTKLRFCVDNGITLCRKCHKEFHKLFGKTIKNLANSVNSLTGQRRAKWQKCLNV